MKNKKYSKGFTLVELLVVIAIIGILAAVVLVSLSSQRANAKRASALQSIKSAMPLVIGCLTQGYAVSAVAGGSAICSNAAYPGNWPDISATSCTYPGGALAAGASFTMDCTNANIAASDFVCSTDTGACQ